MPEWCTDEVYKKLQDLMALELEFLSYTTQLKRLNGGMLIKKFIENSNITGKRTIPRKIYVYSAHEINISGFARAHNFSEPRLPDYGSAFIFEKLRDDTGELYIRVIISHSNAINKIYSKAKVMNHFIKKLNIDLMITIKFLIIIHFDLKMFNMHFVLCISH